MKSTSTILVFPRLESGTSYLKTDPEHGQPLGTPVSEERIAEAFEHDLDTAISECKVCSTVKRSGKDSQKKSKKSSST